MPKFKIYVKTPYKGAGGVLGRYAIIEADSSISALQLARGQYGPENVVGGASKIPEPTSSSASSKNNELGSSRPSGSERSIEEDEESLRRKTIKLYLDHYGKSEFTKLVGKDPNKLTYKEAMDFNRGEVNYEKNKSSLFGKLKNKIIDDEKYRKEHGVVAAFKNSFTKDFKAIGSFFKKKNKKD